MTRVLVAVSTLKCVGLNRFCIFFESIVLNDVILFID